MKPNAMYRAVKKAGSPLALSRAINLHIPKGGKECIRQQVEYWLAKGKPPSHWVIPLEKATGIPRHEFRPDIYPVEK